MDSYQQNEEHSRLLNNQDDVPVGVIIGNDDRGSSSSPNRPTRKSVIIATSLVLLGYVVVGFSLLRSHVSSRENNGGLTGFVIPLLGSSKKSKKSNMCRDFANHAYSTSGMAINNPGGTLMIDNYIWAIKQHTTDDKVFEYYLSSLDPVPALNDTVFMEYGVMKLMDPEATYGPTEYCDFMFEGHIYDDDTENWITITGDLWGMSYDGKDWIIETSDTPAMDQDGLYEVTFSLTTTPFHKKKHCKHHVKKVISAFEDHGIEMCHDLKKICKH